MPDVLICVQRADKVESLTVSSTGRSQDIRGRLNSNLFILARLSVKTPSLMYRQNGVPPIGGLRKKNGCIESPCEMSPAITFMFSEIYLPNWEIFHCPKSS
jgi:hypothetical protein